MNAMLAYHNEMLNDFIQMTRDGMGGDGGGGWGFSRGQGWLYKLCAAH